VAQALTVPEAVSMDGVFALLFLGAYLVLQLFVLPRLGVPT
jgi:hypothetical protein